MIDQSTSVAGFSPQHLGFAGLPHPSYDRAHWALRTWLDSWSGIGHVAVGMHRQGFDLQLTQYDERGRDGTLADQRDGHRVGADAVACDAEGGVGGAHQGRRGWLAAPREEEARASSAFISEKCVRHNQAPFRPTTPSS